MKKADRIRAKANLMWNMIRLRMYRIKISLYFAVAKFTNAFAEACSMILRLVATPRGKVIAAVFIVVTILPTSLFIIERNERIAKDSELRYLRTTVVSDNTTLINSVQALLAERAELKQLLLDDGHRIVADGELHLKVVATGYSSSPYETDSTPFITASNTATREGIIALSRDLLRPYNPDAPFAFGDRVQLGDIGEFIVEDSMHRRWKRRADIWFPSKREAIRFGKQEVNLTKKLISQPLYDREDLNGRSVFR
jgi:3D (Asp-Asp-Asp) domain-containing protein